MYQGGKKPNKQCSDGLWCLMPLSTIFQLYPYNLIFFNKTIPKVMKNFNTQIILLIYLLGKYYKNKIMVYFNVVYLHVENTIDIYLTTFLDVFCVICCMLYLKKFYMIIKLSFFIIFYHLCHSLFKHSLYNTTYIFY